MRLQLFLSRNGVCSRRKALPIILSGHVKVNGQVISEPSTEVDPQKDTIECDGKVIQGKGYSYLLLNKPAGYVTTKEDRFAEKTVFELLPQEYQHLVPVGRLDQDTEGLLLFTNDGDLTFGLTHPKFNIDKVYFVRIKGKLEQRHKTLLENGIMLEGKKTSPAKINNIKITGPQTELFITIHEGRKRQIRLMFAELGYPVVYLKRMAQGPLTLGNLPAGQWRELEQKEIEMLKRT